MGGGTSRMEKMISRHTQSPAGKAKAASRNVDRALKELSGKLQSRGLSLGSEEAEIRLQSVLSCCGVCWQDAVREGSFNEALCQANPLSHLHGCADPMCVARLKSRKTCGASGG